MYKLFIAAALVLLDQGTKLFALKILHQNQSLAVIDNVIHFTLVYNTGSAFGLLPGLNWILTYATLFAVAFILFLMGRRPHFKKPQYLTLWQVALMLILSGATGNLIDRLRLGYVVDFIDLRIWPVFNLADSLITIGVCILAFLFLKKEAIS